MTLKRAILTEELFLLCKEDALAAMILRQLLYWTVRIKQFDAYLQELIKIKDEYPEGETVREDLKHGWIYKSSQQLADELMGWSRATVQRRLSQLVEMGLLDQRTNPEIGWDKTYQYRVNPLKIESELNKLGFSLSTVMGKDIPHFDSLISIETIAHAEQSTAHAEQTVPESINREKGEATHANAHTHEVPSGPVPPLPLIRPSAEDLGLGPEKIDEWLELYVKITNTDPFDDAIPIAVHRLMSAHALGVSNGVLRSIYHKWCADGYHPRNPDWFDRVPPPDMSQQVRANDDGSFN